MLRKKLLSNNWRSIVRQNKAVEKYHKYRVRSVMGKLHPCLNFGAVYALMSDCNFRAFFNEVVL